MGMKRWWRLLKEAVSAWSDDFAPSMGAALSYYMLFSIAPLLVIVIALAGFFFGAEAVRGEVFAQLSGLMGQDGAAAIEGLLKSASEPKEGAIATAASVAVLLLGATTALAELQSSLDRIWRAPAPEKIGGVWTFIRARLLSFAMILTLAFLLMVSLVLGAGMAALGKWWGPWFTGWETLAQIVNFVLSFGLTTVLFAMIYKIVPRVHIRWHDVWVGAAVTAVLFAVGKILIGLYLGKSGVTSGFGAAGSLVLVMVWVYYSAQVFLIGAEFTWVYAHEFGSRKGLDREEPEDVLEAHELKKKNPG